MAIRIRDPAEIRKLIEFGEIFEIIDFGKKEKKIFIAEDDNRQGGLYEENFDEEFCKSWACLGRGGN